MSVQMSFLITKTFSIHINRKPNKTTAMDKVKS